VTLPAEQPSWELAIWIMLLMHVCCGRLSARRNGYLDDERVRREEGATYTALGQGAEVLRNGQDGAGEDNEGGLHGDDGWMDELVLA